MCAPAAQWVMTRTCNSAHDYGSLVCETVIVVTRKILRADWIRQWLRSDSSFWHAGCRDFQSGRR